MNFNRWALAVTAVPTTLTSRFPTNGYARVLLFIFIRPELGGTGTRCLFQFTYCVDAMKHNSLSLIRIVLTLNAPIATRVVYFSRLLKCFMANSVNLDKEQSVLGQRCLLIYLIRQ